MDDSRTSQAVRQPSAASQPAEAAPRGAGRRRRTRSDPQALPEEWPVSADGQVAHRRAAEDLASGRVQVFDDPAFAAGWDSAPLAGLEVEWVATDEFTRRHERLRGRSRRAFAAALDAFRADLAAGAAHRGRLGFRSSLHVRRTELEGGECLSMAWSAQGRATFRIERGAGDAAAGLRIVWLAIGPHGSPNRKGARNR